jgi:phage/plasmid primase-like uncharacterized protein
MNRAKGIDVEAVKRQAAGKWPEILSRLTGLPLELFDGKYHRCPKCKRGLFRLLNKETGACYCSYCFRGGPANGG